MREYAIPVNLVRTQELSDSAFIDFLYERTRYQTIWFEHLHSVTGRLLTFCMRKYAIPENLFRTPELSDRAFIDFLYERICDTRKFWLEHMNSVTGCLLTFCMREYAIPENFG